VLAVIETPSGFADFIAQKLRQDRQMAEARMTASCTIERVVGGLGDMDPETLRYGSAGMELIYEGKCRVQDRRDRDGADGAGERDQRIGGRSLHLPINGSAGVSVRDIVTILANPDDEALTGRVFTIDGRHEKSQATARRLPIVEVTG
jgi:hypothetical protein